MPKPIILMPSGIKFRKMYNLIIIITSCRKPSKFYAPVVLFSNYHTDMENVNRTRRVFMVTLLFVHPSPCIHAYKHRLHLVITQSFQIVSSNNWSTQVTLTKVAPFLCSPLSVRPVKTTRVSTFSGWQQTSFITCLSIFLNNFCKQTVTELKQK